MPSVIDSFSVAIGLDPKGAKKGAAEAQKAFKDTESVVSKSGAAMASSISNVIKEFVGLFLVIRSVQDAVHFFGELNHTIAQLGYDSKNIGESAAELRTWQQVAEQFGGTADGVSKSIAGINATLQDLQYNGVVNEQYRGFQRLGVAIADAKGNARDYKDILDDTADAIKRQGLSRPRAYSLLQQLGLDEGSINAVLSGRKAIDSMYNRERGTASQTASGVEAAQSLARAWNDLKYTLTGVAAQVLNVVSPSINKMFQGFGQWVKSHQKDIAGGLKAVSEWAQGDGPGKIIDALAAVGDAAFNLAKFINRFIPGASSADAAAAIKANDENYKSGGFLPDAKPGENLWARLLRSGKGGQDQNNFEVAHGLPTGILNGLSTGLSTDPETAAKFLQARKDEYLKTHKGGIFGAPIPDAWRQARKDLIEQFGLDKGEGTGVLTRAKAGLLNYAGSVPDPRATPGVTQAGSGKGGAPGSSTVVNIDQVTVNTKATDAQGVGRGVKEGINKALVNTGNTGLN